MSNFKLIFITAFIVAGVFGFLVFAGIINIGGGSTSSTTVEGGVTIWGTIDQKAMAAFVEDFNVHNAKIHISYEQKDPASFDQVLVEAIAGGTPPDLVLLPSNLVWRFQNKLTHIPFTTLPAQTFQTTFTSASNIFAVSDGTIAVPWASDPLVMYYNRDLLQGAGIALPPTDWDTFTNTVTKLTKKTSDLTVTQAGVAFGSYKNVSHAKDILALLFMEAGSPFVFSNTNSIGVGFGPVAGGDKNNAAISATTFFMGFSDPIKSMYSWNAGQSRDRDMFIRSSLAYYFGSASELPYIRAQNPNLNFGIALPPQSPNGTPLTTGSLYGFAIPKSAPNQLLSYTATTLLSGTQAQSVMTSLLQTTASLIPVRRDVLAQKPTNDPYLGFLYDATLVQKSWLDPNPIISDQIFSNFIMSITSGALSIDQALAKAATQLGALTGSN